MTQHHRKIYDFILTQFKYIFHVVPPKEGVLSVHKILAIFSTLQYYIWKMNPFGGLSLETGRPEEECVEQENSGTVFLS